jgi:Carboxylesterase family
MQQMIELNMQVSSLPVLVLKESIYSGDLTLQTEDDITVSNKLGDMWARFAQTGSPTADGSWARVDRNATDDGIKYLS